MASASAGAPMDVDAASPPLLGTGPSLDRMPDDVLLQIWTLLEDPTPFAQTSKHFAAVSREPYFRARWFLHRYPLYEVIFRAIARPKVFGGRLLQLLLNSGAPLSCHLAQLLQVMHVPKHLHPRDAATTNWGAGLSFSAYLAVLLKAGELYGDDLSLERIAIDDLTFERDPTRVSLKLMTAALTQHLYLPLPLSFALVGGFIVVEPSVPYKLERLLIAAPALAPLIQGNGYQMTFDRSLWLCRQTFSANSAPKKIQAKLKTLQDAGVLELSRTIASNLIMCHRVETNHLAPYTNGYLALLALREADELPFSLDDVVRGIVEQLAVGAADAATSNLLERLDADFPNVDLGSLHVQAVFLKAEDAKLDDIDVIAAQMGRHTVNKEGIVQSCLRNECKTTLPIRYAMKYLQGFDVEECFKELIEALLNQPYRGVMLRELDKLASSIESSTEPSMSVKFRAMLASAVERKDFTHDQLPPQAWSKSHIQSRSTCNQKAPVRSLLACRWTLNSPNLREESEVELDPRVLHSPTGVLGFTQFGAEHGVATNSLAGAAVTVPPLDGGDDLGRIELISLQEALNWNWSAAGATRCTFLDSQRYRNILGPTQPDDVALALTIVEILGPSSRAADVILSHSLLNCNDKLTDTLLQSKVRITLEHLKIALKIGAPVPPQVRHHIKHGTFAFKTWHGAVANEPDSTLLSEGSLRWSAEERQRVEAIGEPGSWPRSVLLHDEAGILRVERFTGRRRDVPALIVTAPRPKTTAAVDYAAEAAAHDETAQHEEKAAETSTDATAPQTGPAQVVGTASSGTAQPQDDYVTFLRDGLPVPIKTQVWEKRQKTLQCWLSHLEALERNEKLKASALALAFRSGGAPVGLPIDGQSRAYEELQKTRENVRDELHLLQSAVPSSQTDELMDELTDLWKDIRSNESATVADKIRGTVIRRLRGKHLFPGERRAQLNKTLWKIRYKKLDHESLDVPFLSEPGDVDFSPGSSGSSDGSSDGSDSSDDEAEQEEPAPKRARLGATRFLARQSASCSTTAATTKRQKRAASTSRLAAGKVATLANSADNDDDDEDMSGADSDSQESKHPLYDHCLFQARAFAEFVAERKAQGQNMRKIESDYTDSLTRLCIRLDLHKPGSEDEKD